MSRDTFLCVFGVGGGGEGGGSNGAPQSRDISETGGVVTRSISFACIIRVSKAVNKSTQIGSRTMACSLAPLLTVAQKVIFRRLVDDVASRTVDHVINRGGVVLSMNHVTFGGREGWSTGALQSRVVPEMGGVVYN